MNRKLRRAPDGLGGKANDVVWFEIAVSDLSTRRDYGEIYWPFALHQPSIAADDYTWQVTHLPSGRRALGGLRRPTAKKLLDILRSLPVDWTFESIDGPKCRIAMQAATPIIRRYRRFSRDLEDKR